MIQISKNMKKKTFFHAGRKKKLLWFANVPYSLKMMVQEAYVIIANYDATRLGERNQIICKSKNSKGKNPKQKAVPAINNLST